ncbi:Hypothetical protein SCF082_LOCUS12665 [Durusdinium trenchii]|uniref:Galectin n=1 Tax=Durusdinium trenchii TaxID=1381693 RepID=A0ABP0JLL3_9DINO
MESEESPAQHPPERKGRWTDGGRADGPRSREVKRFDLTRDLLGVELLHGRVKQDRPVADVSDRRDPVAENIRMFLGEWLDNLGHKIVVTPASQRFGRNPRGRYYLVNGARGPVYVARHALADVGTRRVESTGGVTSYLRSHEPGGPCWIRSALDKRFTISLDRWQQWRCGNGTLLQEESNQEFLTWEAEDGRVSNWERPVPEGPVYFDAPPDWNENEWQMPGRGDGYGQWVAVDVTEMPGQVERAWSFNPHATEFNPHAPEPLGETSVNPFFRFVPSGPSPDARMPRRAYASPKGTPVVSPAIVPGWGRTPTPSPMIRPVGSPLLQAEAGLLPDLSDPGDFTLPAAIELQLVEEGPDALVSGSRFDWTVSDPWRELCKFPKDSCVMSPTFSIQEGQMQLSFYPNGSREAEPGHCSVALSRGPDCPGIKFEFSVNGKTTGPKVCLGRRYLGDYIKPFEDDGNASRVVVSMNETWQGLACYVLHGRKSPPVLLGGQTTRVDVLFLACRIQVSVVSMARLFSGQPELGWKLIKSERGGCVLRMVKPDNS